MLVRWLTDNFGDGLTRRLSETGLNGMENIEAATGVAFTTLLPEWVLANYVSDLEGFTPIGRLSYASWRFRTTYASLNEQAPATFELPFPLVPDQAGGVGGYTRSAVLRSGSGRYVIVRQGANAAPLMLDLTQPDGSAFAANSEVRLNVLRIR